MKKTIIFVITLVMCLSCGFFISSSIDNAVVEATTTTWSNNASTSFAGGTGTSANPYQISTPAQLAYLAKQSNSTANFTKNKYFILTNSLDMSAHEWDKSIGGTSSSYYFSGYFDGKGYAIDNLAGNGLFYRVEATSSGHYIKNFTVKNCNLSYGGVLGNVYDYTVSNIVINGSINVNGQVGGALVDYANNYYGYLKIENCANYATVTSTAMFIGGLVGRVSSKSNSTYITVVNNCLNSGNITGQSEVGGIIGSANNAKITNCTNLGNVTATLYETSGSEAGGIAGICADTTITYCFNLGAIKSNSGYVGAIVGNCRRGSLEYCVNYSTTGKVSGGTKMDSIYCGSSCTKTGCLNTTTSSSMLTTLSTNSNDVYTSSPTIMNGRPHLKSFYWEDYGT